MRTWRSSPTTSTSSTGSNRTGTSPSPPTSTEWPLPSTTPGGPVALIGHSIGGVVGQEIARIRKIDCVLLLASIRSRAENPLAFRMLKPLGLHLLFCRALVKWGLGPVGASCDYDRGVEQELVLDMVSRHSGHSLPWALGRLAEWRPEPLPRRTRVVEVHGDRDITFPLRRIRAADHVLEDGGHFFVYKRGEDLTPILLRELEKGAAAGGFGDGES